MNQHNKTIKIIQTLKKIQFVCEFFILSKVSEDSHIVTQFLTAVEAIKFFFKTTAFAQSQNLYIQKIESPPQQQFNIKEEDQSTIESAVDKQKKLLQLIKEKPYQTKDFQPSFYEKLPNKKQIQLITGMKVPENLKKSTMKIKHIVGEILTLLRPLLSIISIRLFGIESYKSYFFSLFIDLAIILFFQRGLKVLNKEEKEEISERKSEVIRRYLFRRPLFYVLKRLLVVPVLKKFMKEERLVFGLIMSLLDMQSSVTLTL